MRVRMSKTGDSALWRSTRRWLRFGSRGASLLALFFGTVTGPAFSPASAISPATPPPAVPATIRILDGMRFRGAVGLMGKPRRRDDTFIFQDGWFMSENCKVEGFAPGVYWVRQEGGAIHFKAKLTSPEHGAIVYEGKVRGGEIEASFVWRKERWYWNVEREYWFKGKLVNDR